MGKSLNLRSGGLENNPARRNSTDGGPVAEGLHVGPHSWCLTAFNGYVDKDEPINKHIQGATGNIEKNTRRNFHTEAKERGRFLRQQNGQHS